MHIPTSPAKKWRGKDILRPLEEEDENIKKAIRLRCKQLGKRLGPTWFGRYIHRLISTPNTREKDGLTTLPGEVEYRQFKWTLTSILFPSEYHDRPPIELSNTPWRILMRCCFVDLSSQFQANEDPIPWKKYPVGPLMPVSWVKFPHQEMWKEPCWGYRAVFSQEVRDKPRSLTGSWLVIIYIMAKDRKWLAKADERTLITEENLFCMNAYEQIPNEKSNWNWHNFWGWELGELHRGHDRGKRGLVTSDSAEADRLCSLLDENALRIIFGAPFERSWPQPGAADRRVEELSPAVGTHARV